MAAADDRQGALRLVASMRGMDMGKVAFDDDQEAPTIAAGSREEKARLGVMEELLAALSPAKAASAELKLMCLRGRKYRAADAAALVPELLALVAELDLKRSSSQLREDLASGKVVMTGAKDAAGRTILWLRFRYHDPKRCGPRDFARLVASIVLTALKDPDTARCGVAILQDMTDVSLKNLDPKTAKYLFGSIFPRLPVRIGRAVIFNPPWFVGNVVIPFLRMLMSAKLRSRIVIVSDANPAPLYAFLPRSSLTQEHGGSFPFDLRAAVRGINPVVG